MEFDVIEQIRSLLKLPYRLKCISVLYCPSQNEHLFPELGGEVYKLRCSKKPKRQLQLPNAALRRSCSAIQSLHLNSMCHASSNIRVT